MLCATYYIQMLCWLIPPILCTAFWKPVRLSQAFLDNQLTSAPLEKRKEVDVNYVYVEKFSMSSQLEFNVQRVSDLTKYLMWQNTKLQKM